jgi:lysyl-tRNA synthetase class II
MDNHEFGPFFHLKGFYHPLAKNPHRIESYCDYNTELIHMYLEQNDLKQLEEASDRSTTRISPWFLNIIKLGMLETVGCGIGIDRLVKSITGAQSIRQVQPYTLV